jgi:hypothetical protein
LPVDGARAYVAPSGDEGQGLVEYSLLLALIALVVIGIVAVMGQTVSGLWYQRILDRWPSS